MKTDGHLMTAQSKIEWGGSICLADLRWALKVPLSLMLKATV